MVSGLVCSQIPTLHGDANLTEDTHCCWTMWSERSLREAESLWSGGCQPAPLWSEAAQPVLRGGLQHMEGEHRKYEFRRWDFTLRMLDFFFLPPFGTKLRILTYQNTTFYQHHYKKKTFNIPSRYFTLVQMCLPLREHLLSMWFRMSSQPLVTMLSD